LQASESFDFFNPHFDSLGVLLTTISTPSSQSTSPASNTVRPMAHEQTNINLNTKDFGSINSSALPPRCIKKMMIFVTIVSKVTRTRRNFEFDAKFPKRIRWLFESDDEDL
jgi:hypothetical protein